MIPFGHFEPEFHQYQYSITSKLIPLFSVARCNIVSGTKSFKHKIEIFAMCHFKNNNHSLTFMIVPKTFSKNKIILLEHANLWELYPDN